MLNLPLYKQVTDTVIERIAQSQYPPGSMLPSEFDLATELSVSQGTARKALAELEQSGIVERRQGKGTFVTLRTPENSLFSFFKLRTPDNKQTTPEKRSESVTSRKATAREKRLLHGAPERVFEITRIRSFQGKILCQEISVVSQDRFPGLKERAPLPNTLYVLFQQAYATIIISASEQLRASTLSDELAAEMEQPNGTPVIIADRQARDLRDHIVELRQSTYLTSDTFYLAELS